MNAPIDRPEGDPPRGKAQRRRWRLSSAGGLIGASGSLEAGHCPAGDGVAAQSWNVGSNSADDDDGADAKRTNARNSVISPSLMSAILAL